MTKKEQFIEMRNQGMTYQAIADKFGCSKQYVHDTVNKKRKIKFTKKTPYQNLRNYCIKEGITTDKICEELNITPGKLRYFLRGSRSVKFIKGILKVTGLTFEEAFMEDFNAKED